jgi:hypothetical protein
MNGIDKTSLINGRKDPVSNTQLTLPTNKTV